MEQFLCFGDSNTYGLIPGTKDRYEWEVRWTGRLSKRLEPYGIRIIEEGLCGRTTIYEDGLRLGRNGSAILPILLESHQPLDRVILMLGTNDCKAIYKNSAKDIGEGIEKLLLVIRTMSPKTKILLLSPPFLGEKVWESTYDIEFNQEAVEVSKGLKKVFQKIASDFECDFLAASDYIKVSEVDQEHIDEEGQRVLADVIYQKLEGDYNHGF